MVLSINPAWAARVFLVAIRVGALLAFAPVFSGIGGLVTVRVLFTLALSAVLVQGLGPLPAPELDLGGLAVAAAGELLLGGVMAYGVGAAFGAFALAGKVLDIQSGFGLGSVYDPVTRAGAPLFATLLNILAVAVFFGMDAHLALFRGLAFSLSQVPPGTALGKLTAEPIIRQFGLMFSLGIALIVPVMVCLLLVEVGLGMMSRVLPQMNIFVVGVPVKIIAALTLLALTLGGGTPMMGKIYRSIFKFWEMVFV